MGSFCKSDNSSNNVEATKGPYSLVCKVSTYNQATLDFIKIAWEFWRQPSSSPFHFVDFILKSFLSKRFRFIDSNAPAYGCHRQFGRGGGVGTEIEVARSSRSPGSIKPLYSFNLLDTVVIQRNIDVKVCKYVGV